MQKPDDELDKFEDDMRKLKNSYDQFFLGIQKVPPMTQRRQLEAMIHEIGKQKMRDNTRRFRYNTLLSRYNQYREMWARKVREREEGPMEFNRRKAALDAPMAQPPAPAQRVTSGAADPYVKVAAATDGEEVRRLFEQIHDEHRKLGKAPNLTFEQLSDMVKKQSELVRSRYNVNTVAFRVETVDGKVKLKAKPLQE